MFRIDSSVVQHAAQEAENWRINASRSVTPASRYSPATYGAGNDPRPLPPTSAPANTPTKGLHPKRQVPEFRPGSPFAHDTHHRSAHRQTPDPDDEPISPKSSPMHRTFPPPATSAWTSINRFSNYGSAPPPSPPGNTSVAAYPSARNTHRGITSSPGGFCNANGHRSASPSHIPSQKVLDAARPSSRRPPSRSSRKRLLEDGSDDDFDSDNVVVTSISGDSEAEAEEASYGGDFRSEISTDSDSDNVVTSPPPPPPPPPSSKAKSSKRSRRTRIEDESEGAEGIDDSGREPRAKRAKDLGWTKADEEAARILMRLNREDAKLAYMKH